MCKFNCGHRTRVSMVLALTVLVAAATAYGLGATESWRGTLAVALAAGALLALSWILVGVLRQKEERLHHRTLHDPLTDVPNRSEAMGDFVGTGYSNLSYVKRPPVGTLKIDRSYVRWLGRNAEDTTAIVHATVAFAKALGLNLVAERIEDAGQLAWLGDLGCELGRNYNLAKPLSSQEVPAFLTAHLYDSTTTGSR